jgi:hypothetical protein
MPIWMLVVLIAVSAVGMGAHRVFTLEHAIARARGVAKRAQNQRNLN